MTNDDLTPEEREALSSLPRERMPSAGLEDRVVAAMREHGHIARKPARLIRLTTSRVAGLLAACVVLVIGAYSIGLHNRVNQEVLKNIEPQPRETTSSNESVRDETKHTDVPLAPRDELESMSIPTPMSQKDQAAHEPPAPRLKWQLNVPKLAESTDAKKEDRADRAAGSLQKTFSEGIAQGVPPATDLSAPMSPPMATQLRAKAESPEASGSAASSLASKSRTFALHGGTLIVDAPDSVRVVTDEQGRTLLIYTSDGVIRIRLAR